MVKERRHKMETILQISVDEVVLRDAEAIAKRTNTTVTKLFSEFVTQLANQHKNIDPSSEEKSISKSLEKVNHQYGTVLKRLGE